MALRFDKASLSQPKIDHNGYLHADAAVTRVGVFPYRHPDGTLTRELRHPDDVFRPESLQTLQKRPVVDEHPANGRVDSTNTKHLSIGFAGEKVNHDDRFVRADVLITDQAAIDKVMDAQRPKRELSCGYLADVVQEDGVFNGERYDHRQTNIRYNHIALVWKGRAGGDVRLTLDAADAILDEDDERSDAGGEGSRGGHIVGHTKTGKPIYEQQNHPSHEKFSAGEHLEAMHAHERAARNLAYDFAHGSKFSEEQKNKLALHTRAALYHEVAHKQKSSKSDSEDTMTIKIKRNAITTRSFKLDGQEIVCDESSEQLVSGLLAHLDKAAEVIVSLEAKNDELQGKVDALEKSKTDAASPEKLEALARERADACGVAHYIGVDKYDALTIPEIRKAVVKKDAPDLDLAEKSEAYVAGRYDTIVDRIKGERKGLESLAALSQFASPAGRQAGGNGNGNGAGRQDGDDTELSPRERFIADTAEQHAKTNEEKRKLGYR